MAAIAREVSDSEDPSETLTCPSLRSEGRPVCGGTPKLPVLFSFLFFKWTFWKEKKKAAKLERLKWFALEQSSTFSITVEERSGVESHDSCCHGDWTFGGGVSFFTSHVPRKCLTAAPWRDELCKMSWKSLILLFSGSKMFRCLDVFYMFSCVLVFLCQNTINIKGIPCTSLYLMNKRFSIKYSAPPQPHWAWRLSGI